MIFIKLCVTKGAENLYLWNEIICSLLIKDRFFKVLWEIQTNVEVIINRQKVIVIKKRSHK